MPMDVQKMPDTTKFHCKIDMDLLGEMIKGARKNKGWSQQKLADITLLSRSYISDIERGKRSPGFEAMLKILMALSITTDMIDVLVDSAELWDGTLAHQEHKRETERIKVSWDFIEDLAKNDVVQHS